MVYTLCCKELRDDFLRQRKKKEQKRILAGKDTKDGQANAREARGTIKHWALSVEKFVKFRTVV